MRILVALLSVAVICGVAGAAEEKPYEPDENTVLLLHMDEGAGEEAKDSSASGLTAKFDVEPRKPTWEKAGKFGGCLRFDGDSADNDGDGKGDADSLVINDPGKLGPTPQLTVEMWIKPERLEANQAMFNRAGGGRYNFFLESTRLFFIMRVNTEAGKKAWASITSPQVLKLNEWQHIAAVCDGKDLMLYHNGRKVKEAAITGTPSAGGALTTIARDGDLRCTPGGIRGYEGLIDEIRISKIARDPKEFNVAAKEEIPPKP